MARRGIEKMSECMMRSYPRPAANQSKKYNWIDEYGACARVCLFD